MYFMYLVPPKFLYIYFDTLKILSEDPLLMKWVGMRGGRYGWGNQVMNGIDFVLVYMRYEFRKNIAYYQLPR